MSCRSRRELLRHGTMLLPATSRDKTSPGFHNIRIELVLRSPPVPLHPVPFAPPRSPGCTGKAQPASENASTSRETGRIFILLDGAGPKTKRPLFCQLHGEPEGASRGLEADWTTGYRGNIFPRESDLSRPQELDGGRKPKSSGSRQSTR